MQTNANAHPCALALLLMHNANTNANANAALPMSTLFVLEQRIHLYYTVYTVVPLYSVGLYNVL